MQATPPQSGSRSTTCAPGSEDRQLVILVDSLLGRALEANRAQPLLVTTVPRPLAGIREPAPQEHLEQPVPTASAVLDGVLATATQIARRFLFLRRRLHLREQPSSKEFGELLRVAPVRLDVIAWLHRDQ